MAFQDARDIAEQLADRAEAVCRKYLPNGVKSGNYWMVGDVSGAPGRSMHVRLKGPLSGRGAAGKWADEASGDFGNLLDIIKHACGYGEFPEVLAEARRFLSLPDPLPAAPARRARAVNSPEAGREFASRLFTSSQGLAGTVAETYLKSRGIVLQADFDALRFHPRCFHSKDEGQKAVFWPTLVAAATDLDLGLAGVSRTFLARDGRSKAPVEPARRSKGDILGNGIRFGVADDVLAAGEGLETVLSLRSPLPTIPVLAATGSAHLAAIHFPPRLRTLLVIRDNDCGGDVATDALFTRGRSAGIDVVLIEPEQGDLNDDLVKLGAGRLRERVRRQLPAALIERFMVA
jgi:hypothetical protein